MIFKIKRLKSRICIIHQIPKKFFNNLESARRFDDNLFPDWFNVFDRTALRAKFETVYNKYKAIQTPRNRLRIIEAFTNNNKIFELCQNSPDTDPVKIKSLPKRIQKPLRILFEHLYDESIHHPGFLELVGNDTIRKAMLRFQDDNGYSIICPFCGLETFLILDGQRQPSLDHWLPKAVFPQSAVNFNNLVPMGNACNAAPAKGVKPVIYADNTNNRTAAYYPYREHAGVDMRFTFINEPAASNINKNDWRFQIMPADAADTDIFNSWLSIFNIQKRYDGFFEYLFDGSRWERHYRKYLEDNEIAPADNIAGLKESFRKWKNNFNAYAQPGALLYVHFIDYLINRASDGFLYGIGRFINNNFQMPAV